MNKRDEILSTAYDVFLHRGYHNTTMKDIASNLSIKRTTLYDYFSSKESIVFALIENMFLTYPLVESEGTFQSKIDDLTLQILHRVKKNIGMYRILFSALPALDETMSKKISLWQKPIYNILDNIINQSTMTLEEKNHFIFLYLSLVSKVLSDYISNNQAIKPNEDFIRINQILFRWLNHA